MILQYDLRYNSEITPDIFHTQMIGLKHKKFVSLSDYNSGDTDHISISFVITDTDQTYEYGIIRMCELLDIPYELINSPTLISREIADSRFIDVRSGDHFNKATIAVVIASYNYGGFLIEAVESVLRQTRKPDEIWISDDFSSDNTEEIARSFVERFPEYIKYNRNEENLGIVEHFNKAVSLTDSDYICFLGADNRFRSDYIEKTAAVLDANESVGVAYTDFSLFGPRAKMVYANFDEKWRGEIKEQSHFIINFPDYNEESRKLLNEGKNFIHGSSMYRRVAFDQVGGYVEKLEVPEDYNFFLRMTNKGWGAKRVGEPLLEYRQHSTEQANHRMISLSEVSYYRNLNQTLKQVLEEKDKYIHWLENIVSEKEKGMEWLESQMSERDQGIEWLNKQSTEKDEKIKRITCQLREQKKSEEKLMEQLDKEAEKNKELEQEINELQKKFINKVVFFMRKRGK